MNGFWEDGRFRPGDGVHIGWAISLRGGGLVAPAIRDADHRSLDELMALNARPCSAGAQHGSAQLRTE